jgi:hypothetical protein
MIDAERSVNRYLLIELWRRPYRLARTGWRYDIERVGNWIRGTDSLLRPLAGISPARAIRSASSRGPAPIARSIPELQDNFSAIVKFRARRLCSHRADLERSSIIKS